MDKKEKMLRDFGYNKLEKSNRYAKSHRHKNYKGEVDCVSVFIDIFEIEESTENEFLDILLENDLDLFDLVHQINFKGSENHG